MKTIKTYLTDTKELFVKRDWKGLAFHLYQGVAGVVIGYLIVVGPNTKFLGD